MKTTVALIMTTLLGNSPAFSEPHSKITYSNVDGQDVWHSTDTTFFETNTVLHSTTFSGFAPSKTKGEPLEGSWDLRVQFDDLPSDPVLFSFHLTQPAECHDTFLLISRDSQLRVMNLGLSLRNTPEEQIIMVPFVFERKLLIAQLTGVNGKFSGKVRDRTTGAEYEATFRRTSKVPVFQYSSGVATFNAKPVKTDLSFYVRHPAQGTLTVSRSFDPEVPALSHVCYGTGSKPSASNKFYAALTLNTVSQEQRVNSVIQYSNFIDTTPLMATSHTLTILSEPLRLTGENDQSSVFFYFP